MSEINEVTETKSRKPLYIGASVLVALALVGGFAISANTHAAPDAAPSVTAVATASADPSVTPVVTGTPQPTSEYKGIQEATQEDKDKLLAEFANKPLGVDVDEVMKNRLADDVLTVFPQDQFKTKEGVSSVLNAYRDLAAITAWTHARNGAEDAARVAPFGAGTATRAAFSADMMGQFNENIGRMGRFSFGVSTVAADGSVKLDGVTYQTNDASIMNSKSNQPAVMISKSGDMLHIEGTRYYTITLADGQTLIGEGAYNFDASPVEATGQWVINRFGEKASSIKVVPNAEAQAWYAKAGTNG
jgi:hypothetical protein